MQTSSQSAHQPMLGVAASSADTTDPDANPTASILIADALSLFRHGLRHALLPAFASHLRYKAASRPELLTIATIRRPDVVLLASNLDQSVAELIVLIQQVRQLHHKVGLIVLVDLAADSDVVDSQALRRQVPRLLLRTASPAQVCDCVQTILRPNQSEDLATLVSLSVVVGRFRASLATSSLSPQQLEVLHLIALDQTNEEIAAFLCVSVRTVDFLCNQMLQQTGARTILGVVLHAQRIGILPKFFPCQQWPNDRLWDAEESLAKPLNLDELPPPIRQPSVFQISAERLRPLNLVQQAWLQSMYTLLEKHLGKSDLSVEWLAEQLIMSRKTLLRKMQTLLKLSPSEVIQRYRLRRAAELLQEGHSVAETAYIVGFNTPVYFAHCFKKFYHITPSEFARN